MARALATFSVVALVALMIGNMRWTPEELKGTSQ